MSLPFYANARKTKQAMDFLPMAFRIRCFSGYCLFLKTTGDGFDAHQKKSEIQQDAPV